MLVKIFSTLILILIGYGITVFIYPETAHNIDTLIGAEGLSERIRGGKETLDKTATELPDIQDIENSASNAKDTFFEGVDATKEKIDSLRSGAQKVENTYNEVQENLENIQETIDSGKESFENLEQKFNQFQDILNGEKTEVSE